MRLVGRATKESAPLRTCHKARVAVRAQAVQASIGVEEVGAARTTLANSAAA
jgi:hypothetical protein